MSNRKEIEIETYTQIERDRQTDRERERKRKRGRKGGRTVHTSEANLFNVKGKGYLIL